MPDRKILSDDLGFECRAINLMPRTLGRALGWTLLYLTLSWGGSCLFFALMWSFRDERPQDSWLSFFSSTWQAWFASAMVLSLFVQCGRFLRASSRPVPTNGPASIRAFNRRTGMAWIALGMGIMGIVLMNCWGEGIPSAFVGLGFVQVLASMLLFHLALKPSDRAGTKHEQQLVFERAP